MPPNPRRPTRAQRIAFDQKKRERKKRERAAAGVLDHRLANHGDVVSIYDWKAAYANIKSRCDYETFDDFVAVYSSYPNKWTVDHWEDHTDDRYPTNKWRTLNLSLTYKGKVVDLQGIRNDNVRYFHDTTPSKAMSGYADRTSMNTMGRPSRHTRGRSTCHTGALAGQASKLVAGIASKAKGAKAAVGDMYWKSADTKITENLKSQHANFVEEHKAHAKEWAADLANLTKDLQAALAALAKAEKLDNDDPKREKKVESAESKRDKVFSKMDSWLDRHDDAPREKVGQMFEFKLGGTKAAKRLERVEAAAHAAVEALDKTYAGKTSSAIADAQKLVTEAVAAAVKLGWPAKSLSNRTEYGV